MTGQLEGIEPQSPVRQPKLVHRRGRIGAGSGSGERARVYREVTLCRHCLRKHRLSKPGAGSRNVPYPDSRNPTFVEINCSLGQRNALE